MTIKKKSNEDLQSQVEWFLDWAVRVKKVTWIEAKKILSIFWFSKSEKNKFFNWMLKKFWRELDITDHSEIENMLNKKQIDFEYYWGKYQEDLKPIERGLYQKYLNAIKIFKSYESVNFELNDDIIKFITESDDLGLKKLELFLTSKMYKNCSKSNFDSEVLHYILYDLHNLLDSNDFRDLLNLLSFDVVTKFSWFNENSDDFNIYNIKSFLLIKKNCEIFSNIRNLDKILWDYILLKKVDETKFNQLKVNIEIFKNNPFIINCIWDSFDEFFSKDFQEIINSEKDEILNHHAIWSDFNSYEQTPSEEQKKYLESIFDWNTFDLSDKEKLKALFKLPEIRKEPTIVDRLKVFNNLPKFSLFWDDLSPIKLFSWDEADYFGDQRCIELTGMTTYELSEDQKQFLESIFDWYTFDLTQENEEQLMQLFPSKEIIQETDIMTRLENFNIIKTEIPDITNNDFEKRWVYSHLLNDLDSEKLRNYLKSLKELWFNEKNDLLEMLIYWSNDNYSTNWDCYLDDVLEITKLYMGALNISSNEILKIYKTLFYYDYFHKDSLEPIFDNEKREYIKFYKDQEKILALKGLWLSNKAIIACQFTSIELFETLLELWMSIDEINKIFEEDPAYSYDYWNAPKFSTFIQYLLRSNEYGIHRWKRDNQKDIFNLKSLLKDGKQKYIIPLLRIIWDEVNKSISFDGVDWIQKFFEKIDSITDKIAIEDFIVFFKWSNLHINVIYQFIEILDIIVKNLYDINIEKLSLFKDIAKNLYIRPKNLELVFEKYPQLAKNTESTLENINALESILRSEFFPENFNVLYEKFPISITELIQLKEALALQSFAKNFKIIYETFSPFELEDFENYWTIFSFAGEFPENLQFKENNPKWYLAFICDIVATYYKDDKKAKMIKKIASLSFEQAENYLKIFKMLDESISMDIQRVKNELIDEILDCENPEKTVETIINIFERNNLPLTWKIFKVFELLYPKEKFKATLQSHGSPVLHKYLDEWNNFYDLIYRDLMNIAIKSWDRSLRDYLSTFVWSEELLKNFEKIISSEWFDWNDPLCLQWKFDEKDREKDEEAQAKLLYLFRKMSVLYNRYFWKEINEWNTIEDKKYWESTVADNQLVEFYNDIKKWFHLRKWESIYDRLQRFLWWLWYHSFNEVLKDMNESKKQAHERWLTLYNEAVDNWWKINFPKTAFLKWVNEDAFSKIINRWVTCREYLWWWDNWKAAWSDWTPFDIDWLYLDSPTNWNDYGNILLITDTNRCNIIDTRNEWLGWYKENQYELFKTWVVNQNHYWIRTWIPTTEVDYIIFNWSFEHTAKIKIPTEDCPDWEYVNVLSIFQNMCYEIARNGYYIPIVDNDWNVKFTPEMYHQIRAWFNYMQYYDGFDVEQKDWKWVSKESDNEVHKKYIGTNKEKITDGGLRKLISDNSPNNEKYSEFAKKNKKLAENTIKEIKRILHDKCGITFNSRHDTSITWAELHDSWSTWRWTDIPTKDVDLDFTLLLDAKEYDEKLELIKETIYRETGTSTDPEDRKWEWERKWWYQMKSKKNTIWQCSERPNWISLDLLILKKSQVIDYSSSDAMKEKLNFIKDNLWKEDLNRVRTNVIIMKKLLKSQSCYKKTSAEWWIAWIWVENWITQHHWSFIEALESFEKVAYEWEYGPWRQPIPLERFKELYPIYDAWENYKDWCNDNFVEKINEHGYNWMLNIVIALRTKWIEWIEELIKKYEKDKAKHIN